MLLLPTSTLAAWSGISLFLGDETIPIINNSNEILTLTPFKLGLAVEDRTDQGLRVGARIAKVGVKLANQSINNESSGDEVALYLYLPYQFNEFIGISSRLSISKLAANPDNESDTEVTYLTKKASLGMSFKWQNIRVMPSINAFSLDGDFKDSSNNVSFSFRQQQTVYSSLDIDYFVEQSSFIRVSITEHSEGTFSLSFSTIY